MRASLGIVATALCLSITSCGDTGSPSDAQAEPSSPSSSPAVEFEYQDPDAAYADLIAVWEKKARGPKGKYAAKLAKADGWVGDGFAVRDITVDTCLNMEKYREGSLSAFYAWTYVLNDVGRNNSSMPHTKQAVVASYFIGAACPDLGEASQEALREALESVGGE